MIRHEYNVYQSCIAIEAIRQPVRGRAATMDSCGDGAQGLARIDREVIASSEQERM